MKLKMIIVTVAGYALYLVGFHTYWPFGDEARKLSNIDSLWHASFWLYWPWAVSRFIVKTSR